MYQPLYRLCSGFAVGKTSPVGVFPDGTSCASREAEDMLTACYLPKPPLIEVGDIFCRVIAIGVNSEGYRKIIGAVEGMKEDHERWKNFFSGLKSRGLKGVRLIIGDKCLGMLESIPEVFPEARYQRCTVHFYRSFHCYPKNKNAYCFNDAESNSRSRKQEIGSREGEFSSTATPDG